jgi:hypothetical protein
VGFVGSPRVRRSVGLTVFAALLVQQGGRSLFLR